jgi:nucleoid-associated protein YgaU
VIARRYKLFAALLVVAAGLLIAWPLRRTEPLTSGFTISSSVHPVSDASSTAVGAKMRAPAQQVSTWQLPRSEPATGSGKLGQQAVDAVASNKARAGEMQGEDSAERIHVVHQGDSLERLAKRYLGDESRSLEIFDLNRKVLENPHLLPLGAELRIPAKDRSAALRKAAPGK